MMALTTALFGVKYLTQPLIKLILNPKGTVKVNTQANK